jgi:type I restriction enzyme S subunit
MKSTYDVLGKYIRPIDVRNVEGKEENLLGVTTQKYFMPSIANTIGTDFSKYKVVRRGQFTYVPDTSRRGDRIAIALLQDWDEGLVSNIYTVFEVTDESKLLPEYLMLWFKRPEFDRYARFKSHGSVREVFDWDELCGVVLPVPDIEVQRSIVRAYNVIEGRIRAKRELNDNLEATATAIFCEKFVSASVGEEVPFTEVVQLLGGGTPQTDNPEYWDGGIPFFTPKDISTSPYCIKTEKTLTDNGLSACSSKLYALNTVFVTCRGTVGNVAMADLPDAIKFESIVSPLFAEILSNTLEIERLGNLQGVALAALSR